MFSWIKPIVQKEDLRVSVRTVNDQEEDGFLVVGQTRSEQNTVITSEFQSEKDGPPTYMETSTGNALPNYSEALSRQYSNNSQCAMGNPHGYGQYQNTPTPMDCSLTHNAVQDVPFCINPKLQFMWGAGKLPVQRCYDSSKYEYDFTLEYSILNSDRNVYN